MRYVLGLDTENSQIRTALLKEDKGTISLENVKTFVESDSFVKQLYMGYALPDQKSFELTTALKPHEVLFRTLSLPIQERKKVLAALPFQLETLLPFPVEEANIFAHLTPIGKEAHSINFFAVKNSVLETHLDWAHNLQIEPDYVTCAPQALFRICQWLYPGRDSFSCFYLGETKSCCIICSQKEIIMTQTLHVGYQDFLNALALDFPLKSLDEISLLAKQSSLEAPLPHFSSFKMQVEKQLERLFSYLETKNLNFKEQDWIILGDRYPAFSFSSFFPKATVAEDQRIPTATLHEYAIAIGGALDNLASDKYSVQFLKEKWTPKKKMLLRKSQAKIYAGLCLAAACIMGIGGHLLLKKKEAALVHQLQNHLPSNLSKSSLETLSDWEEVLWQWDNSLNGQKLPFPFIPTVASVSDVLAWLSTHPALTGADGGKKEGIEVKNIRYQLYKHPKLGEGGGAYAAKVDLELTATTPRLAREFHDALLKGDQIVDPKKEIKWNAQQNTYWTSFEVKSLRKETR